MKHVQLTEDKVKILHVVLDEKYIDSAYELFEEVVPGCNDFIILAKENILKHIKKAPVIFFDSRLKIPQSVYEGLKEYSFVVLHSLDNNAKTLVANAPPCVKFIWVGFGFDYYPFLEEYENRFLLDRTADLKRELTLKGFLRRKIMPSLKRLAKSTLLGKMDDKFVIGRILYFSPVIEIEYELLKQNFKGCKFPSHVQWNYFSLYKIFGKYPLVDGDGILVGNNASSNNNHLDAFETLSKVGVRNRKIICPLSYCGSRDYINRVIQDGVRLFGEDFNSLISFVEKDAYFKNILGCSYVVMNHIRQQGAGNISFMLYSGSKVFLRKDNPLYVNYKNLGLVLYTMEELEKEPELIHTPLSHDDAIWNRNLLAKIRSKEVALEKTRNLIDVMQSA